MEKSKKTNLGPKQSTKLNASFRTIILVGTATFLIVLAVGFAIYFQISNVKSAFASSGANLNQARNGTDSLPTSPMSWVNGNLGAGTAHYVEEWSAPYQCVMTGLTTGTQVTLTIGYDIRN